MHSVYALITQVIAERVVASSASILGSATLTTDESMKAMLEPRTDATSTQVFCRLGHGGPLAVERMIRSSQGLAFGLIKWHLGKRHIY